jgi:perosamine synthetase
MRIPEYEEGDAIMAVHNLGNIMSLNSIECPVIEDSCETLFGKTKQKQSLCASLSFFGNKNMTSGEGGAVLTEDEDIFKFLTKLKGQGQTSRRYIHDELGYNYRMTNIQAALLLGQLEEWDNIYGGKQVLFMKYNEAFKDHPNIIPQQAVYDHSRWMYAVRILGSKSYEDNKRFFDAHGVDTRPMFYSFKHHKHLDFLHNMGAKTYANAERLHKEIVMLPSYPELKNEEVDRICAAVIKRGKDETN